MLRASRYSTPRSCCACRQQLWTLWTEGFTGRNAGSHTQAGAARTRAGRVRNGSTIARRTRREQDGMASLSHCMRGLEISPGLLGRGVVLGRSVRSLSASRLRGTSSAGTTARRSAAGERTPISNSTPDLVTEPDPNLSIPTSLSALDHEVSSEASSEAPTEAQSNASPSQLEDQEQETESFVRRARQTFGDTLPADYLQPHEQHLYNRLYGKASRHTDSSDLAEILGSGRFGTIEEGQIGQGDTQERRRKGGSVVLAEDGEGGWLKVEGTKRLEHVVVDDEAAAGAAVGTVAAAVAPPDPASISMSASDEGARDESEATLDGTAEAQNSRISREILLNDWDALEAELAIYEVADDLQVAGIGPAADVIAYLDGILLPEGTTASNPRDVPVEDVMNHSTLFCQETLLEGDVMRARELYDRWSKVIRRQSIAKGQLSGVPRNEEDDSDLRRQAMREQVTAMVKDEVSLARSRGEEISMETEQKLVEEMMKEMLDEADGHVEAASNNDIDDGIEEQSKIELKAMGLVSAPSEDMSETEAGIGDQGFEDNIPEGSNQREMNAIAKLQRDLSLMEEEDDLEDDIEEDEIDDEIDTGAIMRPGEERLQEEEDIEDGESGKGVRAHPHTVEGRSPVSSTVFLPAADLVEPCAELLRRADIKHLTEAVEKAFGGRGLPHSPSTPALAKTMMLQQKHIGLEAGQGKMSEIEADAYLAAVMPPTFATCQSVLVEVRKRLGSTWLRDLFSRNRREGPRVLDAGGAGAGVLAWQSVLQAEWDVMRTEGFVKTDVANKGKSTVLLPSHTLRHRVSRFLNDTTFLPRLPDYIHATSSKTYIDSEANLDRKAFDIIIAPHTLLPLKEDYKRKQHIQNLWALLSPHGGVLVLLEKGIPRGFEAIAEARAQLLRTNITNPASTSNAAAVEELDPTATSTPAAHVVPRKKEEGMIIAPCTNHGTCPMYATPGTAPGRKDYCHFEQRYIRPPYLQSILGAKSKNHEDVKYSYVVFRRGIDTRDHEAQIPRDGLVQNDAATSAAFAGWEATGDTRTVSSEEGIFVADPTFQPLALPRMLWGPLKRRGHVTLDVCTPSATLERWTVPRSFSRQAYRDARKSAWGDLWALGAKTRVLRNVRLGRDGRKKGRIVADGQSRVQNGDHQSIEGKKRTGRGRMPVAKGGQGKQEFQIEMDATGMKGVRRATSRFVERDRKRSREGRRVVVEKYLKDDAFTVGD